MTKEGTWKKGLAYDAKKQIETIMTIAMYNSLELSQRRALLQQCCGSSVWIENMCKMPHAEDLPGVLEKATETWYACSEADWKEAFLHHPKIGDINALKEKFSSDQFAGNEQKSINDATGKTLQRLSDGNKLYEDKFGYIFIVCATGKSPGEMLELLMIRLQNSPEEEIKIAMEEQNKITKLRLEKLFTN